MDAGALFERRRAGVLLHISSLPSPYGPGDLGHAAYRFVEFLARAGFTLWQTLPVGPTHAGLSPYDSSSVHAGNPAFIGLDWLVDHGLLARADVIDVVAGDGAERAGLLARAAAAFATEASERPDHAGFAGFCAHRAHWLEDFALFTAIGEQQGGAPWFRWPAPLRDREPAALAEAAVTLAARIAAVRFEQYVFARQWAELRAYAAAHGVRLLGDMPIFVAHDSADVWAARSQFRLDDDGCPAVVTGVPPDYFSADGQRWGNPHYDWARMQTEGFGWWRARLRSQLERFDGVRIDHFRGFEACWEIPAQAASARDGRWVPAPGDALLEALRAEAGEGVLLAENLGTITPAVEDLRLRHGLPGMLILQFAFDGSARNPYLPHNHLPAAVVYTGTHDNDTTLGWHASLPEPVRAHVDRYLGHPGEAMPWPLLRAAFASVANTAIVPLQDLLALDGAHRMNTPGIAAGNWRWQFRSAQLDAALERRLREMMELYDRSA